MLVWQFVVNEAKAKGIDCDGQAARRWINEYLPSLFLHTKDDQGNIVDMVELFDWEKEWPIWKGNFQALLWLADRRNKPPKPNSQRDRIERTVADAVMAVCEDIGCELIPRVRAPQNEQFGFDYLSQCDGVKLCLKCRDGTGATHFHSNGNFDDLAVFWQAVFVSFFDPSALSSASVCKACGAPLAPTKKFGKASQGEFCKRCAMRDWRQKNYEQAKELNREHKREERERNRPKRTKS